MRSAGDIATLTREVIASFREHQPLVAASAIAFRVLIASVVGAQFLAGMLGFFGLSEVWRSDLRAGRARFRVGPRISGRKRRGHLPPRQRGDVFWATLGAAIALWQLSRVVRVSGQTLNRVYGVEEQEDPVLVELYSSIKAAAAVGALLVTALVVIRLGPLAADDLLGESAVVTTFSFVVRWTLAAALLLTAVGIVVRTAPAIEQPLTWVSFGSALIVAGWILSSLLFSLYLNTVADFGNVYGVLLAVFLLIEYLYFAAVVFLGGLVIDRLVQKRSRRVVICAWAPVAQWIERPPPKR